MKRYKVQLLDAAATDIIERIDYVRFRWGDEAAKEAHHQLKDKLALLATPPHLGFIPPECSNLGIHVFRLLVHEKNTKILYEVDDHERRIFVHAIFSSTQDFQTLLYRRIMRS